MLDKSLFVSDTIHEREVELADGSKHTMYFRELPASEFQLFHKAITSDNEKQYLESMPRLIAVSLCTKEGKPAITTEQAKNLKIEPMQAIFEAIQEVNSNLPKKMKGGGSGMS